MSERTLATALKLGLQAPDGSDMALRLLVLWMSGDPRRGWLESLGVSKKSRGLGEWLFINLYGCI